MTKAELGRKGERLTAAYLIKRGYEILEMNYSCRFGEIDIIAHRDGVICFTEVKTRSSDQLDYGLPSSFVNCRKRKKLSLTADDYLYSHRFDNMSYRFDISEIVAFGNGTYKIRYLENAFEHMEPDIYF